MRSKLISVGRGILKPLYGASSRSKSSATTSSATAESLARNLSPDLDAPTSSPPPIGVDGSGTSGDVDNYRHKVTRRDLRFAFPEFLPDPEPRFRNKIVESLMRRDMLRRRNAVEIPEFYVGSVVAVTISDKDAPSGNKEGHT